jgi:eukaryotic-like serine/threonine-protein kinase
MSDADHIISEIREAARKRDFELDVLEFHAEGGTSTIFKGTHEKQLVAVKRLLKPDDKKWLSRLNLESKILAKLDHRRVVKLVGPGLLELDQSIALITEFISGESLRKMTEGKRLGERDALFLLREIADALHHVHEKGIIHRDLHDANIMLRAKSLDNPVVIDFCA